MPGPIEIDPDVIRPQTDIAYQDEAGNWRAGPDAKGYEPGQFVEVNYAKRATGVRKRTNMVKSIQRGAEVPEDEARERGRTILEKLEDAETDQEEREIWQEHGY